MSPKSSPSILTSPIPRADVKRSGISLGQTLRLRVVVRGAHGHRQPAPSSHLEPLGLGGLSIPGKLRPREADTGAPNPSSPQLSRQHTSSKKCFKMARFDDNQGGMFGGGWGATREVSVLAQGCWHRSPSQCSWSIWESREQSSSLQFEWL